ncbi:MAG: hypothetical protein A2W91_14300 [Bacteroidetes bacterium GWF2_38_335]|nr:MAG: hypothetical protein A2W91_14300 [Bacteroidetes bacterium GWF2_38_335]OFY79368.1 MAG: hypothetical protein A2281_16855 [Bacteroidetes bacterium RIFOXYA12_FULL_38_20]HBS85629.1 hypothetical protein [Bacteroidales bacterium]
MKTLMMTVIILIMGISNSYSQEVKKDPANETGKVTAGYGNYTDKNDDGVCDNYAERHSDGKGIRYSDSNDDGVCDNYSDAGHHRGHGYRNGGVCRGAHHKGYGHGHRHWQERK